MNSGSAVTICFSASREKFCLNSKSPIARERARFPGLSVHRSSPSTFHLPLTRPNSTKPPAEVIRAVSSTRQSLYKCSYRRTLVGRLVVVGQWLCDTLVSEDRSRVSSVGLQMSRVPNVTRKVLTQIIRPSFVTKTTTAVHPDGSLKKFGSESQF